MILCLFMLIQFYTSMFVFIYNSNEKVLGVSVKAITLKKETNEQFLSQVSQNIKWHFVISKLRNS